MRFLDIFIVFARNNLMNIMCKVGDYILKVNNIGKPAPRQIPKNAIHKKLMIALLIIEKKNRKLQKVRFKVRLRILNVRLRMSNVRLRMSNVRFKMR